MSFEVPKNLEAEIDELITHYPVKRSASLMLLHAVQEHFGHVSKEAIEWIAKKLDLQPINVYELVTFYPMFRQEAPGKYQLKVCRTLSCALGIEALLLGAALGLLLAANFLVDSSLFKGLAACIELACRKVAEARTGSRCGGASGAAARLVLLPRACNRPPLLTLDHDHVLAAVAEALLDVPG